MFADHFAHRQHNNYYDRQIITTMFNSFSKTVMMNILFIMMMIIMPALFCNNKRYIVSGWQTTASTTWTPALSSSRSKIMLSSKSSLHIYGSTNNVIKISEVVSHQRRNIVSLGMLRNDNNNRINRNNVLNPFTSAFIVRGGGNDATINPGAKSLSTSSSASESSSSSSTISIIDERNNILQLATESLLYKKKDYPIQQFGGLSYVNTDNNNDNKKYRIIFILGGPGAGKGTQCELMLQNYPTIHFSVGELLRNEQLNNESQYQQLIIETLASGKIVPVDISLQLLHNAMKESLHDRKSISSTIVLVDGFPRNYNNLYGWCTTMKDTTILKSVLVYQCPLNVLEERIIQRSKDAAATNDNVVRSDDNRIAIQKRFMTFQQQTIPLVNVLRDVSEITTNNNEELLISPFSVIDIAADQSIDNVWYQTQKVLNQYIMDDVLTANNALLNAIATSNITKYQELSDSSWFTNNDNINNDHTTVTTSKKKDPLNVFYQNEGKNSMNNYNGTDDNKINNNQSNIIQICNATIEVISGKHLIVGYNRRFMNNDNDNNQFMMMNEKRVWTHNGINGWQQIHFIRKPIEVVETTTTE